MSGAGGVVVTGPLELRPMTVADADELWPLLSDPRLWQHEPAGRHTERTRTVRYAERAEARWAEGLSYWTVRLLATGQVVGSGGAQSHADGLFWNLNYRVAVDHQGRGYAGSVLAAALAAACGVAPERPAVAWVDPPNAASAAVARRGGLTDHGVRLNPVDPVRRHAWADRPLVDGDLPPVAP